MNTDMQGSSLRGSSAGNTASGSVILLVFFVVASIGNLLIIIQGTSWISTFVVGEVIIGLLLLDFFRIKLLMHVYQIILIYFYFSLVIFHSFNEQSDPNYTLAYLINCLHFLFFAVGYQLIPTRNVVRPVRTPKQNVLTLIYIIFTLGIVTYTLWGQSNGTYSNHFLSYEEHTSQSMVSLFKDMVFANIMALILFLNSHPMIFSISVFFDSLLSYPLSGIKAPLVTSFCCAFLVTQLYIYRFSVKWFAFLCVFIALFGFILIGSSSFRGTLSLTSLIDVLLDIDTMFDRWRYFIIQSPESRHISYTADILRMIESQVTDFRYGFDYYRFILYPFKSLVNNWELASYNQFPVLLVGENVSMGLYLGLACELFWNFGWFFPLFSLAYGCGLKWFTNFAFSGKFLGLVMYLMLFKVMVWHLYRGEANAMMIVVVSVVIALIVLGSCLYVRQVRMLVDYMSKFVVKLPRWRVPE